MSAPVTTHRTWRHLLREISSNPLWRPIGALTERERSFAFAAPVALARWIATQAPHLLDRPSLRMVVAGAELVDALDDGLWYASIPMLLGRPAMTVDVSLVGRELGARLPAQGETLGTKPLGKCLGGRVANPSRGYRLSLSEFLVRQPETPDIVAFFHPGFVSHHETWFADDAIHRLIRQGVPLFGASMHEDDYVGDRLALESYGFSGVGEPLDNAFTVESENDMGYFAKCLWRFPSQAPSAVRIHDPRAYERLEALDTILVASFHCGHMNEIHRFGMVKKLTSGPHEDRLIALPFGHWVSTTLGTLYAETDTHLVPWIGHVISPDDLAAFPGPETGVYERAVWAVDIASKYDITPDTLESGQALYAEIEETGEGSVNFSNLGAIFSDREHLKQSLAMTLDTAKRTNPGPDDLDPEEAANLLAEMFAPEPKRTVPPAAHPLFAALAKRDFAAATDFLTRHPDMVDVEDEEGQTPLYVAVTLDQDDFLESCHQLGADPNHRDREGWPVVMEATRRHAKRAMAALLRLPDVDVNAKNKLGWTALLLALSQMEFATAEMLLDAGADVDTANLAGVSARAMLTIIPDVPESLRVKIARRPLPQEPAHRVR